MNPILALLRRALALYSLRLLEIQLSDQTAALQHARSASTLRAITTARDHTKRELIKARRRYLILIEPAHGTTWRTA